MRTERRTYAVTVERTQQLTVLVEAETREDAVAAVSEAIEGDPDRWDYDDSSDLDVDAYEADGGEVEYGVVNGELFEAGDEYAEALQEDEEHPVDRLTLPLFPEG